MSKHIMKVETMNKSLLLLTLVSLPLGAADIHARITGFHDNNGVARLAIFSKSQRDAFPSKFDQANFVGETTIKDGSAMFTIKQVPEGDYALFVYHDANGNNTVDHKWYGPPAESFAYYKPFTVKLMPPDFEDVAFTVTGSDMDITFALQVY